MKPLIAKSSRGSDAPLTLLQHTKDVVSAAVALFGHNESPTRLGRKWIQFFRIESTPEVEKFFTTLNAACWLHDIGKANAQMQDILYRVPNAGDQLFRHEYLSVLIMSLPGFESWFSQRKEIEWGIVLAAIGSHHLKFSKDTIERSFPNEAVELYLQHADFVQLLQEFAEFYNLASLPVLPQDRFWGFVSDGTAFNPKDLMQTLLKGVLRRLDRATADESSPTNRLLRAVRAALIVADASASGLRRENESIERWIASCFSDENEELLGKKEIEGIILARITELSAAGKWQEDVSMESEGWNLFQTECDQLPSRAGLLAPCGAGKTLAAWRWIAARPELPVKRVLFLYPTRATATEGFKDYVSWAPESTLLHGNAQFDLEGMFSAEDPRTNRLSAGADPRLFALQHWNKQVFSATVDQFFSFMSYNYSAICLLPLIADSVIVIDEVHSFDQKMFSALLSFLRVFDVPVLCMTATLQAGRAKQLQEIVGDVYNDKPADLAAIANAPRYRVQRTEVETVLDVARQSLERGLRVLWVVNQVSRAQEIASQLRNQNSLSNIEVVCYHSRFRLKDRRDRHQETVKKIRPGMKSVIAITTQVCEMSLDIDADVLISEWCPISSAIQRMGRCRRGRDELKNFGPGDVYFYKPSKETVYSNEDLHGFDDFLNSLALSSPASQSDLEIGMSKYGFKDIEPERRSSFLTSGPYAMAGEDSFRDIEEFSQPCVLDEDLEEYLRASPAIKPGFICPVPKKLMPTQDDRLPPFLHVAKTKFYSEKTGYHDIELVS